MVKLLNCLALLWLLFPLQVRGDIPPDFYITKQEHRLYELINEHRVANGLPKLSLSVSLSYVACTHVADLVNNRPDTSICNLNSWSDKGNWTPCCHNNYVPKSKCILNKPRELTSYRGDGHELAYWEPTVIDPDSLIVFWASVKETNNFLLNREKWAQFKWRSIGVGILEGYAVIWVGDLVDRAGEPVIGEKQRVAGASTAGSIPLITGTSERFYVIVASYELEQDAMTDARALSDKGYDKIKVVRGDQNYRVSLADFQSLDEAKSFRSGLGEQFRNVWILNY